MKLKGIQNLALLAVTGAIAHSSELLETLPALTVDATRITQSQRTIPFAISTLTADQIQTASTQLSLDDSLQTIPGTFVLNPNNFAQDSRIAIRGFGARANFGIRGIRLLVDGIPATTPDGQGSVDGIDLGAAQSIEIVRGPASGLYGAASGGVILIETEDGPETPFAETRWTFGDYGLLHAQFKAGGQSDHFNYLVSTSYLDFDGYRDHNETENKRLNAKFRYDFSSSSSLTALINIIDLPLQNDPGALTYDELQADPSQARQRNVDFDSGESVQQELLGVVYDQVLNDQHALELKSYYTHRDFANRLPFETGGQVAFERNFYGGGVVHRFTGDRLQIASGIEYELQDDARENHDNLNGVQGALSLDQDERIVSISAFTSLSYELNDVLTASAALRHDTIDYKVDDHFTSDGDDSGKRAFNQTSPMLGLTWQAAPALTLFTNVSTAFETPTSTELANPNGGGGFNLNLDPQTARNYELGIKGNHDFGKRWLRYELTAFQIDIDDALVIYATDPDNDFYRNAGESTRRGIEAALHIQLLKGLTADLSYTWSDFTYDAFNSTSGDFSGNQLPGIPEHFGNLQLNYQHENGYFIRWNTRFIGNFYANDANTETIESYSVSDLRIGIERPIGNWTFEPFLGINNLFDESYSANIRINGFGGRYYEPAPGRNLYTGIRLRYDFQ
ncbi:MAG: TonB-dependent receptor family protein [Opitutaceae bacterium]